MDKNFKNRFTIDVDKITDYLNYSPMWGTAEAKVKLQELIDEVGRNTDEQGFETFIDTLISGYVTYGTDKNDILREITYIWYEYGKCEEMDITFVMEQHEYTNGGYVASKMVGWIHGTDEEAKNNIEYGNLTAIY